MKCKAKHVDNEPTDAEFVCPHCGRDSRGNLEGFWIDSWDKGAHARCELLHDKDRLICTCGFETSGKDFSDHVGKLRGVTGNPLQPNRLQQFRKAIQDCTIEVVVVGLGYVGLPLAVAFAKAGINVRGVDSDEEKIKLLARNKSYLSTVTDDQIEIASPYLKSLTRSITTPIFPTGSIVPMAFVVCMPTPLTPTREPDLRFVKRAIRDVAECARGGDLVVLESTTYPGTTRELAESLRLVDKDIMVAYSPEREDPGNKNFKLGNTPKLVGGIDVASTFAAQILYEQVCEEVVTVRSPEVAECAKLFENVYRAVNVALVNELKVVCEAGGLDVWDVLEAAGTKPFGFQRFNPGPGLGGHCFLPGTPVMTLEGPIPIERVEVGQLVLTEGGRMREVERTFEHHHAGELVRIKVRGMPAVCMTPDHGIYVARDGRPAKAGRLHYPIQGKTTAELLGVRNKIAAGDLVPKSDLVAWPIATIEHTQKLPTHVTPEYIALAGWYLSEGNLVTTRNLDGSIKSIRVQVSLCGENKEDIAFVKKLLPVVVKQFNDRLPPNPKRLSDVRIQDRGLCIVLRQGCTPLGEQLDKDFGQHAEHKRFPGWLLWGQIGFMNLALRGMFRGDGHAYASGGMMYSTTSMALAYGVASMLDRMNVKYTLEQADRPNRLTAYAVKVRNGPDAARLSALIDFPLKCAPGRGSENIVDRGDGYLYRHVSSIEFEDYEGPVHNLQVADTRKYVVPIGMVSNCLPCDPFYLSSWAKKHGTSSRFIELAGEINNAMPLRVADRVQQALNDRRKALKDSSVLVLGLAYKENVDDTRESPAMAIMDILAERGARLMYHDPHVPVLRPTKRFGHGLKGHESVRLDAQILRAVDCVLVVTAHNEIDWDLVVNEAELIVDTRNVLDGLRVVKA